MFTVALTMLLLASATDTATAAPSLPTEVQTDENPKAERKICKREDSTESRLGGKRVCLTAEQWRERQRGATRDLGDVSKQ